MMARIQPPYEGPQVETILATPGASIHDCQDCIYWKAAPRHIDPAGMLGWCCRYPQVIEKKRVGWGCGEFRVKVRHVQFAIGRWKTGFTKERGMHVFPLLGLFVIIRLV